jgi:hypothetical protein
MRPLRALIALLLMTACNRGDSTPLRRADGSLLSSSGGEVALADGSRLQFVITSERYKQWDAARSALRANVAARFGTLLQPKSPTEKTIARAVSFLETDVASREAIERTGMSVKDFVLMTVALEQEMRVASGGGAAAATQEHRSMPAPFPPPVDSGFAAEQRAAGRALPGQRVDTSVKVDTIFQRPTQRDTAMRKRDTLSSTPRRDTVRDTTALLPPDPRSRT